ncbi:MAG: Asp23/Gls24 family envelope stress response protein [Pseudonocardiales bacterium]|nr:MAG: Asp23/Gls24 family envelope stress response protein [Pseudonocardiales bacterium]
MADTTNTPTQTAGSPKAGSPTAGSPKVGEALNGDGSSPARVADDTSHGKTTIASSVVQKIAGIAAREISGVYKLGGGMSRAFGEIRERLPGSTGASHTTGVSVEVGEKQAAIDLDIIVTYGASIVDLAKAVRRNVIGTVEQMTGMEVIEVNIAVNDIYIASENDDREPAQPARVQ